MKWIKEKKIIKPHIIGNWKIIPEEWWQKGKEKDYQILFEVNTTEHRNQNDTDLEHKHKLITIR